MCTLCSGTAFGECVLNDGFHSVSVISNESCTLLRVPKSDFQDIWQKSSHFMEEIVTPPFSLSNIESNKKPPVIKNANPTEPEQVFESATPAAPISVPAKLEENNAQVPNNIEKLLEEEIQLPENVMKLMHVGWVIRLAIEHNSRHLIRDRKHPSEPTASITFEKCFIGSELIDWLMNVTTASSHVKVRSRKQAESMYQVLYENKVIYTGTSI